MAQRTVTQLKIKPELARKLRAKPKETLARMRKQVVKVLEVGLQNTQNKARKTAPNDTGTLRNSILTNVSDSRGVIKAELTIIPHGAFQNDGFGGTGTAPPFEAIFDWVKRKKLDFKGQEKKEERRKRKKGKSAKSLKLNRQRKLAYAIAQNIGAKPRPPKKFLDNAIAGTIPVIEKSMQATLEKFV